MGRRVILDDKSRKRPTGLPNWVNYARFRVQQKLQCVVMFKARPGKGKTWSALTWLTMVDPTFGKAVVEEGIKSRVTDDICRLAELIEPENIRPGTGFLFDEGGVQASAKKSQTTELQSFENIIKVARFKRLHIAITAQFLNFYFKSGRQLLDAQFKVMGRVGSYNIIKPKLTDWNDEVEKDYAKYLIIKKKHKRKAKPKKMKIKWLCLPRPPAEVLERYMPLETEMKQDIIHKEIKRMKSTREEPEKKVHNVKCNVCGQTWASRSPILPRQCLRCGKSHSCVRIGTDVEKS